MATTGFKLPTSDTAVSGTWGTTTNAYLDDGNVATCTIAAKNTTSIRSYFNYGFSTAVLPDNAVITQVNLRVEWRLGAGGAGVGILGVRARVTTTDLTIHENPNEPLTLTPETFNITAERAWAPADFRDGTLFVRLEPRTGNNATNPAFEFDFTAIEVVYGIPPTLSDVETIEVFFDQQLNVTAGGSGFGATQGTGRVEIGNNATYAAATKVLQPVASWTDTSIDFTGAIGAFPSGNYWLFVTNGDGATSLGLVVEVDALPTITDVEGTEQIYQGQTAVTITGTEFLGTPNPVELASSTNYATATKVTQTTTSWTNTAIDFTVNLGALSLGPVWLFVTNSNGARSNAFALTAITPGAAWLAALNTAITVDVTSGNVQRRLRVGFANSGGAGATAYKWQYRKTPTPNTWTDINATSTNVKTFASSDFADGDDVPQLITGGSYQTDNNAAEELTGAFTLPAGLGTASVESEIALEVISADLANTETLEFRILQANDTLFDAYTVLPSMTIQKGAAAAVSLVIPRRMMRDLIGL